MHPADHAPIRIADRFPDRITGPDASDSGVGDVEAAPVAAPPASLEVIGAALSLQELADLLGVTAQALYDLRSQGRGPTGFRVGRHLRFRTTEIEAWLARLEREDAQRHPGAGQ